MAEEVKELQPPQKPTLEQETQIAKGPRRFPRRTILKGAGKGALAITAAAATGAVPDIFKYESTVLLNTNPAEKLNLPPRPEGLPEDVLTEKELKAMNITINQTERVQLYLRRSALDMPLYKEAAEGKTPVVISLVDSEALSWDAVDKLPPDARLAWQSLESHPAEWRESFWREYQQYAQEQAAYFQKNRQYLEKELDEIVSGKAEIDTKNSIELYQGLISKTNVKQAEPISTRKQELIKSLQAEADRWHQKLQDIEDGKGNPAERDKAIRIISGNQATISQIQQAHDPQLVAEEKAEKIKEYTDDLSYWTQKLQDIQSGRAETKTRKRIAANIKEAEENDEDLEALKSKTARVKHFAQKGDAQGQFIDGSDLHEFKGYSPTNPRSQRLEFVKKQPGWLNKKYVYVCVGGESNPNPANSYPSPEDFEDSPEAEKAIGYHVSTKNGDISVGFVIRHETEHGQQKKVGHDKNEADADSWALESIVAATKRRAEGDDKGFSFIFANEKGLTFTKRQTPPGTSANL